MDFSRYAIYLTLPEGPLSEFGAAWLGWDAATGRETVAPEVDGLPAPAHDITATPRKYGLHGTIKPPFRLAEGTTYEELNGAFAALCKSCNPATTGPLELARLGSFLALIPTGDTTQLADLAATMVKSLDRFRAAPTEAELEKRRKSRLSPRQDALLTQWGYPYVMDQFKFHITLSGRLTKQHAEQTHAALLPHLAPHLVDPFRVDALTLCGEDEQGRFHELHRYTLSA